MSTHMKEVGMNTEQRLRDAVFTINRALDDPTIRDNEIELSNLISARDQVWMIGVRLYNWKG